MKKSFMTRALATGLSLAMAFSLTAATNVTTAAAASAPAMKSKTMTVKVGQSKNYAATAATQKAYKITKIKMSTDGKTKAKVTINSSKKSIKVEGLQATKGKNVVITFKNNKTGKKTTVTSKVVVKAVDNSTKIASVKQNTFTEFTVTMSKALETVAASDFSMVRDNDNQVITVKSATLDTTDKTKVKLVVYTSLTDAKTYTVTYTDKDEAKTQSTAKVTVTDGTVADVAITPLEITVNQETLIEYQTLDANGVIVSQKKASAPEAKVDVTWDSILGTMDNSTSKYILYNEGDTAKFTVTYHTYKYDSTTGAELGVITKDFTVTAVKDATVVSQFVYTAAKNQPFDWSKVTPKTTIALDDTDRTAWFLIKDSKGNNVTSTCDYTVESSDNSVVVADGTVLGTQLSPVAKGTAYLMIKDKDGKVVTTMPITVGDKRTISTFKLSSAVVNVVTSAAATTSPETCGYTDITVQDQYGEDIALTSLANLELENKTGYDVATVELPTDVSNTTGSIRVSGNSVDKPGYDNYILKATDALGKTMSTSLRVNTVGATGTPTYSVVFLDTKKANKVVSSVNTTISETANVADPEQKLNAVIVKKQNGVVVGKLANASVNVKSLTVTKNDGSTVASAVSAAGTKITSSAAISAGAIANTTGAGINADVLNITVRENATKKTTTAINKNLGVGTYTVVYQIDLPGATAGTYVTQKASASFKVEDKQTSVTAKVKDTACNSTVGGDILAALDPSYGYVDYYFGDVKVTATPVAAKYTISNGDKNAYVTNVTVAVTVANTTNTMFVVVPVNKTFTITGTTWS